jgi:hypothetical protein
VRPVVIDPQIIASGFLDSEDRHGVYRLLGLLAYGRISQYIEILAPAEEDEQRKQLAADPRLIRGGPPIDRVLQIADELRRPLAEHLSYAPSDLVLATSPLLLSEVEAEVEHLRLWLGSPDYELPERVRRVVASISFPLGDLDDAGGRFSSPLNEMLLLGALANAVVVSENDAIAPPPSDNGPDPDPREDPSTGRRVKVMRLWPYICWEVERHPFDLCAHAPKELLDIACRDVTGQAVRD